MTALAAVWALQKGYRRIFGNAGIRPFLVVSAIAAAILGVYCGFLLSGAPDAKLYLSWAVSCLLAGIVGLAFYRGLYVYMRQRARSPLIMLVAS